MIRSRTVDADRLRIHLTEAGPEDGIPVVLFHGNLSTGRFYAHDLDPKPPILWTYGSEDVVISDHSAWDVGTLGQAGHVRVERFEGSGHFPPIDAAERWSRVFAAFVEDAER